MINLIKVMSEIERKIIKPEGKIVTYDELVIQTLSRINKSPYFIAIAGNSGSGKSFTAQRMTASLIPWHTVGTVDLDDYLDNSGQEKHSAEQQTIFFCGYDPAVFNLDKAARDLSILKGGGPTQVPVFDRSTHMRTGAHTVIPQEVMLVEGMRAFDDQIAGLLDEKILVEADLQLRLIRRLVRNTVLFHRTDYDEMIEKYLEVTEPGYIYYLDLLRSKSDFIINNDDPMGITSMEILPHSLRLILNDMETEFPISRETRERLKKFFN